MTRRDVSRLGSTARLTAALLVTTYATSTTAAETSEHPRLLPWPGGLPGTVVLPDPSQCRDGAVCGCGCDDGSEILPRELADAVHARLYHYLRLPELCQLEVEGILRVQRAEAIASTVEAESGWPGWLVTTSVVVGILSGAMLGFGVGIIATR